MKSGKIKSQKPKEAGSLSPRRKFLSIIITSDLLTTSSTDNS